MDEPLERCYLYCDEYPEGKIFEGDDIAAAKENGWKEVPPDYSGDPPVEEAAKVAQNELDTLNDMLIETNVTLEETKAAIATANDKIEALKVQLGDANDRIVELESEETG